MIDATRHASIFDPEQFCLPVHIIGCGGMGSRVAEGLIRMGVGVEGRSPLYLYDHDIFEEHNVANQFVELGQMRLSKVSAIRQTLLYINPDAQIIDRVVEFKASELLKGVVFLCVDSMEARRTIMENALEDREDILCVIETRMDAQVGISHCFDPMNARHCDCWWMYWHSDDEADNIAGCGGPQSIISAIYGTTMLALKQFEAFARDGMVETTINRVYQDFDAGIINTEHWPA